MCIVKKLSKSHPNVFTFCSALGSTTFCGLKVTFWDTTQNSLGVGGGGAGVGFAAPFSGMALNSCDRLVERGSILASFRAYKSNVDRSDPSVVIACRWHGCGASGEVFPVGSF